MRSLLVPTALVSLSLLGLACAEKKTETPAEPAKAAEPAKPAEPVKAAEPVAAADPAADAKTIFNTRCTTCHGASGKGDGPAAAGLNPRPRDYSDAAWQKSVSDEDLAKTILNGGAAVGKSALMPPNPDLQGKPEVVNELVKIVRSFGG